MAVTINVVAKPITCLRSDNMCCAVMPTGSNQTNHELHCVDCHRKQGQPLGLEPQPRGEKPDLEVPGQ